MAKSEKKFDQVPLSACNDLGEQIRAFLSEDGRKEIGDPVPVAPPVGMTRPMTTEERFRRIIRSEHLARIAEAQGADTFEEAEDFDVEDDPIPPLTPYEEALLEPPVRPTPSPVQPAPQAPQPPQQGVSSPPAGPEGSSTPT